MRLTATLILLLAALSLHAPSAIADDYQSPMMKAQYSYLKSLFWQLSRESSLRFCGLDEAANAIKPAVQEQLPGVTEASKIYVASGGRLTPDADTIVFTTVLANSETPMDMGFRLGIGAALDLLGISESVFCDAFTARYTEELKTLKDAAE